VRSQCIVEFWRWFCEFFLDCEGEGEWEGKKGNQYRFLFVIRFTVLIFCA
jgi:hypothetical protein